jgi:hypothetical protein
VLLEIIHEVLDEGVTTWNQHRKLGLSGLRAAMHILISKRMRHLQDDVVSVLWLRKSTVCQGRQQPLYMSEVARQSSCAS